MRSRGADSILLAGFEGFCSVRELRESRLAGVPELAGVYLILRDPDLPPRFLRRSPAGWPKGRDPTLPTADLRKSWVQGTRVIYIGKAGGRSTRSTLRKRIRAYLRHGAGGRAGHWGGRAVWQLADSGSLLLAWRATPGAEPREVERGLIRQFEALHGALPFANRVR